ncbi:MAG: hypothetical protein N4A59_08015 [Marinifilum sp.]|jgi:hypothetical protein|nr:hypothetical protein [Marinifilum sp.]
MKNLLNRELTVEEQKEILGELFGFSLHDSENDGHFVIYDQEGDEFHGFDCNDQFDLTTLKGIITYAKHEAKEFGEWHAKREIRNALGINN